MNRRRCPYCGNIMRFRHTLDPHFICDKGCGSSTGWRTITQAEINEREKQRELRELEAWECRICRHVSRISAVLVIALFVINHFVQIISISTIAWLIIGISNVMLAGLPIFKDDFATPHKCYLGMPLSAWDWIYVFVTAVMLGVLVSSILYFILWTITDVPSFVSDWWQSS